MPASGKSIRVRLEEKVVGVGAILRSSCVMQRFRWKFAKFNSSLRSFVKKKNKLREQKDFTDLQEKIEVKCFYTRGIKNARVYWVRADYCAVWKDV